MFLCRYTLISLQLFLVSAIIFDGPCPDIQFAMAPATTQFRGSLIYFTKIKSTINHFFHNDVDSFDYLEILMKIDIQGTIGKWAMGKWNKGRLRCMTMEFLVPIRDTGYFGQEIETRHQFGITRQICSNAWDRYQLLQRGDFAVIWGCVNLNPGNTSHEEGLWVIQRNFSYGQEQELDTEVQEMFPVGRVTFKSLLKVFPMPQDSNLSMATDCTRIMCQSNKKTKNWKVDASLALLSAICIVGGIFALANGLNWLQNGED